MARGDLVSVRGALVRLGVTSLLTVLAVAAGGVVLAEKIARDESVDDAAHEAGKLAQGLGGRNVYADPGHPSYRVGLERLDEQVQELLDEGVVLRVKVWDTDGTVVYSDEPRQIGRRFELAPEDRALFGTEDAYAEVTDLKARENVLDRELGRRVDVVVEVYAGFESADGRPLLFEAYFPSRDLLHHEQELVAQLVPAMVAGPAVAALALTPFVLSLVRTLRAADEQRMTRVQEIFRARDNERRRLARQIHDQVMPGLARVLLTVETTTQDLQRAGSPRAPALRETAAAVQAEIRHLRAMLGDLRTPAVARLGLADALHDLARPLTESGTQVVFEDVPADLTAGETQLVYGLVGEGLRNVHRHAEARHVQVRVERRGDTLRVEVHDDGRGTPRPVRLHSDHGLGLLADSFAELGGELVLDSSPGRGTVLAAEVPAGRIASSSV